MRDSRRDNFVNFFVNPSNQGARNKIHFDRVSVQINTDQRSKQFHQIHFDHGRRIRLKPIQNCSADRCCCGNSQKRTGFTSAPGRGYIRIKHTPPADHQPSAVCSGKNSSDGGYI